MKLKLLWYCTKAKPQLLCKPSRDKNKPCRLLGTKTAKIISDCLKGDAVNGKIIAESDYDVEEIANIDNFWYTTAKLCFYDLRVGSYLDEDEIREYNPKYAIHIKNLHIFDEPKELSEFYSHDDSYDNMFGWAFEDRPKYIPLKKAHRNMMYVYDKDGTRYILISSHPDCMAQILNGLRTIDPRKRVLKEML